MRFLLFKNPAKKNGILLLETEGACLYRPHAIRDSVSPNPKMLWERKNIEIEMYHGPKYNKTAGTWSLILARLVNFIIFSGKGKS